MNKDLLRVRLVDFQKQIMAQSHDLRTSRKEYEESKDRFVLDIVSVLDSFENVFDSLKGKDESLDKSTKRAIKSFRAIYRKLVRVLEEHGVERLDLADGKAKIGLCKIVETKIEDSMEQGTIVAIVRNGYRRGDRILRLAEVITAS